jgi:hypothetical protein
MLRTPKIVIYQLLCQHRVPQAFVPGLRRNTHQTSQQTGNIILEAHDHQSGNENQTNLRRITVHF